jgi:hypothetical protein
MPKAVIYMLAAALLIGAAPLPAGYYALLRPAATVVFVWAAWITHQQKHPSLPWILGIAALIFNPFAKLHVSKEALECVSLAGAILLLTTRKHFQAA